MATCEVECPAAYTSFMTFNILSLIWSAHSLSFSFSGCHMPMLCASW